MRLEDLKLLTKRDFWTQADASDGRLALLTWMSGAECSDTEFDPALAVRRGCAVQASRRKKVADATI